MGKECAGDLPMGLFIAKIKEINVP